jgi:MFS transporter, PPP family, 3-phenylpropionic acid transporter
MNRSPRPDRAPSVWAGSLYFLFYYLCGGSYFPFLYVHFADLGLSGEQIGLLSALPPIVAVVLSPVVAGMADRNRIRVRLSQAGLVCLAVTLFSFRFPATFGAVAALMLSLAVFSAPFSSVADGLVARMAHRNGFNYGGMRLWGSLGFAVSATVCGLVWDELGFRTMFLITGLLFITPIVFVGFLEEGPVIPAGERKPISHLLLNRGLLLVLAAALLSGIASGFSATFSGIYARSLGGGNLLIGAMFAISAVAEVPTMLFSNRIADRLGEMGAMLASYAVMGLAFLGYALVRDPVLLVVLAGVKGLGYGSWLTLTIRSVTRRTSEEWASTAQATLTICLMGLAPLVAGPVGGVVHDKVSPGAVFIVAAASMGLAGIVALSAGRREARRA